MGEGPSPPQFGFAPRQLIHILSHQLSLLCQHSKHRLRIPQLKSRIPQLVEKMVLLMLTYTDYSRVSTKQTKPEHPSKPEGSQAKRPTATTGAFIALTGNHNPGELDCHLPGDNRSRQRKHSQGHRKGTDF